MRVYLAGPDVFLPNARARGAALKAVCARYGLTGVFPLDDVADEPPDVAALPLARCIALRNELHIQSCGALIANLTPFRGPSADAGTVFEVGFMRALGRPVFGWSNDARCFTERSRVFLGDAAVCGPEGLRDGEGMLVEAFGLADNLMIDGAIMASGGTLFAAEVPAASRWTALDGFERCVAAVAAVCRATSGAVATGGRLERADCGGAA
jgi:nucleoside 2-deoxyribosyltransferase